MPYNAILSDMTDDYNEKNLYHRQMCFSGGTSLLAAVFARPYHKRHRRRKNIFGSEKRLSRNGFGLWFDIRIVLAAGFLGTKEKEDLPPVLNITFKDVKSVFKLKRI